MDRQRHVDGRSQRCPGGDLITIDITLRSDGAQTFGIGGSIYGNDIGAGAVNLIGGTTSSAALVLFPTGPGTGFGGLDSSQAVALDPAGGDAGIQFFNGIQITGTIGTGALDISPITSAPGGPQFQVIVEVAAGLTPGTYTLDVGANHLTDGVIGNDGVFLTSTDDTVVFTVAEPASAVLAAPSASNTAATPSVQPVDAAATVELSAIEAGIGGFLSSSASSTSNFNGDGLDDLVAWADGDDPNGDLSGGALVVYGRPELLNDVTLGTSGADTLNGTAASDQLVGGAGNTLLLDGDSVREMSGVSAPDGSLRIRADGGDAGQFASGTWAPQDTVDGFDHFSDGISDVFITDTADITIDGVS